MIDIDPWLIDAVKKDTLDLQASPSDHFSTGGGLQFDFGDNPRRLRSGHVLDLNGATLELDPDRVSDAMLLSEMAPIMIGTEMGRCYEKRSNPEEAYAAISTGITVKNARLVGNYSKLAPRARALGCKQFAIAGCGLQGHDAHADVTLIDFGAYGREAFPVWIVGADNSFDSHALYPIADTHTFDENTPASTLKYKFEGFVPEQTPTQVTVGMISGALCPGTFQESPWKMGGPWKHMWRRDASFTFDVETPFGKWNAVQGATAYQCLHATIDGRSLNAKNLYYSDYYQSKGVHILPTCSYRGGGERAIEIRLSPTAGVPPDDYPDLPLTFNAEDFVIEKFDSDARQWDVELEVNAMPDGSYPPNRYLRNFVVDGRLRLNNIENRAQVHLIPAPDTKKKGCNPFRR